MFAAFQPEELNYAISFINDTEQKSYIVVGGRRAQSVDPSKLLGSTGITRHEVGVIVQIGLIRLSDDLPKMVVKPLPIACRFRIALPRLRTPHLVSRRN